jgi:hypothetical protein
LVETAAAVVAVAGVFVAVGSLPASSQAAAVSSAQPALASAGLTAPSTRLDAGDVTAVVPEASFGPSDGAPATVTIGQTYPVVVALWVAPGSGPAVVTFDTDSAPLAGCPVVTVNAGVNRIHCKLLAATIGSLDIEASATLSDGSTISHRYDHQRG